MNWMEAHNKFKEKRRSAQEGRRKAMMELAIQISLWSGALAVMGLLARFYTETSK
ncbi:hypothetical protein Q1W73_12275 [Asticcacaulis sp. ZE23SCel15]|uniref:hypothetical protein n=1 Tax=Asticcacaulis sp. ZE23SCel15 TaxID=3059027 RepID=UPI00265DBBA9|nr:hypothetical protein [Asticcacaulis sp. ZE23SCel15]WKL56463.1 hypothetical protein Q1W73_12275 [Asticcacaulis sp. ZE23SCel15]